MNRRSFLLLAGGAGILLPRTAGHHRGVEAIRPGGSGNRFAGNLCRSTPIGMASASVRANQTALRGAAIPKYIEPLPTFDHARVSGAQITVRITEFQQRVLPASLYAALPVPFRNGTFVWGIRLATIRLTTRGLRSKLGAAHRPSSPTTTICRRRLGFRRVLL
jgi:hypothetical protein